MASSQLYFKLYPNAIKCVCFAVFVFVVINEIWPNLRAIAILVCIYLILRALKCVILCLTVQLAAAITWQGTCTCRQLCFHNMSFIGVVKQPITSHRGFYWFQLT